MKKTLVKAIGKLPRNIFVGLVAFSKCVYLYDFKQEIFQCFNGAKGRTKLNQIIPYKQLKNGSI